MSLPYVCYINAAAEGHKNLFNYPLPSDIIDWWSLVKHAILFKDIEYGQWGLEIHSGEQSFRLTQNCLQERPFDFKLTDIVIGEFYGDSDLLLVSCETGEEYGSVWVVSPIEGREYWAKLANSFSQFLEKYIKMEGEKFWEG